MYTSQRTLSGACEPQLSRTMLGGQHGAASAWLLALDEVGQGAHGLEADLARRDFDHGQCRVDERREGESV